MNFENILLEKKNSIAYVTVNRPKVLNALNMATMEELRAAFHDIKNDAAIRVVILTGAGEKALARIKNLAARHETQMVELIGPKRRMLLLDLLREFG